MWNDALVLSAVSATEDVHWWLLQRQCNCMWSKAVCWTIAPVFVQSRRAVFFYRMPLTSWWVIRGSTLRPRLVDLLTVFAYFSVKKTDNIIIVLQFNASKCKVKVSQKWSLNTTQKYAETAGLSIWIDWTLIIGSTSIAYLHYCGVPHVFLWPIIIAKTAANT